MAENWNWNKYTLNGLFVLYCFNYLNDKYKQNNLSQLLFLDTSKDILIKIDECKKFYGVYGTFVASWFYNFFALKTFKFGRLEYQSTVSNLSYERYGVKVNIGNPILLVHIPSGSPLNMDDIMKSLKIAYKFYNYHGKVAFKISSWITLKENIDIFPKNSNLIKFYNLWDIVRNVYDDSFKDCWRIFNRDYENDPSKLIATNKLQKNIVNYLKRKGKMGTGDGFLIFDGKNIIK